MPLKKINIVFNENAIIQNLIVFFLVSKQCDVKIKKRILKKEYIL